MLSTGTFMLVSCWFHVGFMSHSCHKQVTQIHQRYLTNGSKWVRFDVFFPRFLSRCENCSIPANTLKMGSFGAPEMHSFVFIFWSKEHARSQSYPQKGVVGSFGAPEMHSLFFISMCFFTMRRKCGKKTHQKTWSRIVEFSLGKRTHSEPFTK